MINPFQMNDWDIKKFLGVILSIQLAVWGVIGMDSMSLQIPILRQIISFIYLTFVPGILIIRCLKLHKLGNVETLLYSVGLSIATLIFTGFFMNIAYPLLGISEPISTAPLLITISVVVLMMCILSYVNDKDFSNSSYIDIKGILSIPTLLICLIPFLSIFGTYLVNSHQNNIFIAILIFVLSIIVILIGFDKFIPCNLKYFVVFIISISLLYHRSLISMYLWGWDIQVEYFLCNLVKANGIWDLTNPLTLNSALSIVIVAPIYSIISNMDTTWVLKIIYPFLFSLVPLGLFCIFQKQSDDKVAFLSCFFFMSIQTFYGEMLQLGRQQIAELFLVLWILLLIDKNIDGMKKSFISIIFGASLAVSHYAISYIYILYIIVAWLILNLGEKCKIRRIISIIYSKFGKEIEYDCAILGSLRKGHVSIRSGFISFFIIFTFAWYIFVSNSSVFNNILNIGNHIANSVVSDFLDPKASYGLYAILADPATPLHRMAKYVQLFCQFLISLGIIALLLGVNKTKFEKEYVALSYANFIICCAAIIVPHFVNAIDTTRLYHITLIFLAPFCIIGWITASHIIFKAFAIFNTDQNIRHALKILSVFLAIILYFSTGLVYEIARDNPTSISLNNTIDYPRFNDQEVSSAKWLYRVKKDYTIYSESYKQNLFWSLSGSSDLLAEFPVNITKIYDDAKINGGIYIYVKKDENVLISGRKYGIRDTYYVNASAIISDTNGIYTNGWMQIKCK